MHCVNWRWMIISAAAANYKQGTAKRRSVKKKKSEKLLVLNVLLSCRSSSVGWGCSCVFCPFTWSQIFDSVVISGSLSEASQMVLHNGAECKHIKYVKYFDISTLTSGLYSSESLSVLQSSAVRHSESLLVTTSLKNALNSFCSWAPESMSSSCSVYLGTKFSPCNNFFLKFSAQRSLKSLEAAASVINVWMWEFIALHRFDGPESNQLTWLITNTGRLQLMSLVQQLQDRKHAQEEETCLSASFVSTKANISRFKLKCKNN